MDNKRLILEKLEIHKRQAVTYEIMNKCTNHLFDAYREMELALQFCDNPEMRKFFHAYHPKMREFLCEAMRVYAKKLK